MPGPQSSRASGVEARTGEGERDERRRPSGGAGTARPAGNFGGGDADARRRPSGEADADARRLLL